MSQDLADDQAAIRRPMRSEDERSIGHLGHLLDGGFREWTAVRFRGHHPTVKAFIKGTVGPDHITGVFSAFEYTHVHGGIDDPRVQLQVVGNALGRIIVTIQVVIV